jgi:hypothetical protein
MLIRTAAPGGMQFMVCGLAADHAVAMDPSPSRSLLGGGAMRSEDVGLVVRSVSQRCAAIRGNLRLSARTAEAEPSEEDPKTLFIFAALTTVAAVSASFRQAKQPSCTRQENALTPVERRAAPTW